MKNPTRTLIVRMQETGEVLALCPGIPNGAPGHCLAFSSYTVLPISLLAAPIIKSEPPSAAEQNLILRKLKKYGLTDIKIAHRITKKDHEDRITFYREQK